MHPHHVRTDQHANQHDIFLAHASLHSVGLREFVMVNDNSTDHGVAEVMRFAADHATDTTVRLLNRTNTAEKQANIYNRLKRTMSSDWFALWDIDEWPCK
jgi:purine-nucleoside phosphorylase